MTEDQILKMCREKYPELVDADDEFFLENPVLWPFAWEECLTSDDNLVPVG